MNTNPSKTNSAAISGHTESRALPVAAHTPGPWTELEGFIIAKFSDGIVHDVCDPRCAPSEGLEAEMEANARLISAAPELLAIVEELLRLNKTGLSPQIVIGSHREEMDFQAMINSAEVALSKAKGQ